MRRLSSLIILLVLSASLTAQKSPHGESLKTNCDDCHKTSGWKVDLKTLSFNHNSTKFPLVGQHQVAECKQCHTSLEFAKAQPFCNSCHTDIHEQTVGNECARCHTPNSWVVTNITQLHQQSRFPLIGPHKTADCSSCHKNLLSTSTSLPTASLLRFDPMGIECYDCHKNNYIATTKPNHKASNYSTNCTDCHNINSFEWAGAGVNHNFFPLKGGHEINDCKKCHTSGVFSGLSNECLSCHQSNYTSTANPNHTSLGFSTNCKDCHSLDPGWKPAEYRDHDTRSFPIYSGKHEGEWENCSDCHTNPADYKSYSCIDCHEHSNSSKVDGKHDGVPGYSYNSIACYGCHPTGTGQGNFDHNAAGFPLTNGHAAVDCSKCHTNGFSGTSNACASCHTNNYNQTTNPNHSGNNISTDCKTCHTTIPGWKPASYPTNHSNLTGVHIPIANECATCHNGNYTTPPTTCYSCHSTKYNQSSNPSHTAAQFPTTCADCHTQTAWTPATFDHDGQYFPVYTGKHKDTWTNCNECHTIAGNYQQYSCISCHDHNKTDMDTKHNGVGGYQYNSIACLSCHPTGIAQGFDHSGAGFPLTGGHSTALCSNCHTNGYVGTSPVCASCHTPDYNSSVNPSHNAIGISNDCKTCHTTNPGWNPATFPTHNNYYVIAGAHIAITNQCADCHNGNYNSTPNTCSGCHLPNYNQTTNPNHATAQFPTSCADCHSQTAWSPSTYNHDAQYFPIYSGKHKGEWTNCNECHTTAGNFAIFSCIDCHEHNQSSMASEHQGVNNYAYNSIACFNCHPKGNAGKMMNSGTYRNN